jgi:hypothetical protein
MYNDASDAAAGAIRAYERIVQEYEGELDAARLAGLFGRLRELVTLGGHTGAFGRILVSGIVCPSGARQAGDIRVQYREKEGAQLREMEIMTYLEYCRPFKPDLV